MHVIASVIGLTAILASSSMAFTAVKLAGACYLLWIGIQAIFAKSGSIDLGGSGFEEWSGRAIFWQGFISDVLNPKVAIFFLAFLPQFVDVHNPHLNVTQQLLLLGVTCNVIAISINLALVYFAALATQGLRRNQRLVMWLNKAAGALFVGLGIRLANERL